MALKIVSAIYVLALVFFHAALPEQYVFQVAVFFSIAMNFTYPIEAFSLGKSNNQELSVSLILIGMSLLSIYGSPLWVIAAIFGHGLWDVLKMSGFGIRFFRWYTNGCVIADCAYGSALLIYFVVAYV